MRRISIVAFVVLAFVITGCGQNKSEQVQVARIGIKKLDKAVKTYAEKKGTFPTVLSVLVDEGLLGASDIQDPWDQEYQYDPSGTKNRGRKPDIWTVAPDQTHTVSN